MLKWISKTSMILFLVAILTSCGGLSKAEKQEFYEKAIPIGQEYFKKYYDAEVEFNRYEVHLPMSSTIVLYGHVKDDPYTSLSLSLSLPSLKVNSAGGPGDFIKKRKSEDEANSH
ncbi:hypothetical protein ACN9MH_05190 [Paenibacillus silvae]|uniref:hypothetical protein n=1 Tax=Paenibacillus silvae TaxID=1325358 RepID=UPI0025A25C6D|nr:hypothetical protein [Paenibacillus silvae]MDM5279657.1 hypothetical protein [Paenibacillus silvae]